MANNPALSLDTVHDLRACLPDLVFDPDKDRPVPIAALADQYLQFYNIHFDRQYFHRLGRIVLPPYTVAVHYWLPATTGAIPEKGMVMVVHGYFDHMGLYEHLTRFLLENGYGVIGFDLPGHGLSSGERASIESFDHYVEVFESLLQLAKERFSCPISAIGQSTGGAILLKHLATWQQRHDSLDLHKVTLLAPLVQPALWWFNKWVYALTHTRLRGIRRKFRNNTGDEAFIDFVKSDPLQPRILPTAWLGAMKRWVAESHAMKPCPYPVTILQGKADTTLAWRANIRLLRKKFPNSTINLMDDVQHHMANEIRPLRDEIYASMGF